MKLGKLFRVILLIAVCIFAFLSVPHWDVEAVPTQGATTSHLRDLSSGEVFGEGTLDLRFLGFIMSVLISLIVYSVFWIRAKRIAL